MIFHDYYTNIPAADIARFVATQELGRLITVGADGMPRPLDEQASDALQWTIDSESSPSDASGQTSEKGSSR